MIFIGNFSSVDFTKNKWYTVNYIVENDRIIKFLWIIKLELAENSKNFRSRFLQKS